MKNLLLILLLLIFNSLYSQYSFEYTIVSDEDELLLNGIEDNENNIILVGRIGDRINEIWDPYIIKIQSNGDTISKRFHKADTNSYFRAIELLEDGNYLAIGLYSLEAGWNYDHLWVCKIDTELNILFEKSYKVTNDFYFSIAYAYSMTDSDHNIILAGSALYYTNYTNYHWDMTFVKLNQQGDTLLTKTHHYQFGQSVDNISQVPNSKDYLAIAGNFNSHNFGPVRLDSAFNILNIKHFYSNMMNQGSAKWLTDTSYIFSTLYVSFNNNDEKQISVYHIDTAMNYLGQLVVGKIDTADYPAWRHSIAYANDTTIYIGGMELIMGFYVTTPNVLELYVIDRELNLLGYKEFGSGNANYQLWGMLPTSDMGCLLYGTRYSEENGNEYDIHIIKLLREDINIIASITEIKEWNFQTDVYPNPVKDILHIKLNSKSNNLQLQIYNSSGKLITNQKIIGKGNVLDINVKSLTHGAYFYRITNNKDKISTGKFIKTSK